MMRETLSVGPIDPVVLTGIENATEQQIRLVRLDICAHCSHNNNLMCMACGCSLVSKTANMAEYCPLRKW